MPSRTEQLKQRLTAVREQVTRRVKETAGKVLEQGAQMSALATTDKHRDEMETLAEEPPVVARLVVEIRSDGSRTIARGALKDELSGEQVTLEAKGSSPLQLASQLARSLLTTPLAAGQLARAMMAARRDQPNDEPKD
jgi:hypothetical protein